MNKVKSPSGRADHTSPAVYIPPLNLNKEEKQPKYIGHNLSMSNLYDSKMVNTSEFLQ